MTPMTDTSLFEALPCGCKATACDNGVYTIEAEAFTCTKRHKQGDTCKRIYTLIQTVAERHYYDPDEIRREFGDPAEGEAFEDFVVRVFERFDGSIYGDEFFPTDANPQVSTELVTGWDDD